MIFLKVIIQTIIPPPPVSVTCMGVIFSLEREKWWGFFMGWVLKGSRQKLVVCRYEEEPARGVSLVVK